MFLSLWKNAGPQRIDPNPKYKILFVPNVEDSLKSQIYWRKIKNTKLSPKQRSRRHGDASSAFNSIWKDKAAHGMRWNQKELLALTNHAAIKSMDKCHRKHWSKANIGSKICKLFLKDPLILSKAFTVEGSELKQKREDEVKGLRILFSKRWRGYVRNSSI